MLTTFARRVGMPESFTFTDVFGLDEELLMMVPHPCFALTLLFPVAKMGEFKREQRAQIEAAGQTLSPKLFYVTQVCLLLLTRRPLFALCRRYIVREYGSGVLSTADTRYLDSSLLRPIKPCGGSLRTARLLR
eukprot:1195060-Prorocentrum_minimum.AAC.4